MSGALRLEARSARWERWRAVAPRVALFGVLGVLVLASLLAVLRPSPASPASAGAQEAPDLGAAAFAEGFVRVYLSLDAGQSDRRERELAEYLSDQLEPDGGLARRHRSAGVGWTAVEADSQRGRRHTITVVAQTTEARIRLAVPVERDEHGFLYVADYPALVGPPATNTAADMPERQEVEDPRLRAVVERALTNYLAGEKRNLLADLAPEAVVSLPAQPLDARSVAEITWVRHGRTVAALADAADPAGNRWTLRYELGVRKRERWYVRWLAVDPTPRGDLR